MTIQGVARRFEYLKYNIVISQKVVVILKRNARTYGHTLWKNSNSSSKIGRSEDSVVISTLLYQTPTEKGKPDIVNWKGYCSFRFLECIFYFTSKYLSC